MKLKTKLQTNLFKRKFNGEYKDNNGYIHIYEPTHPNSRKNGSILRSRFIMSNILGRPLEKGEIVHHKNRIKDDDKPENLELFKNHAEHICKEKTKYVISYKDIEEIIGNNVINRSELQSRIMNKYSCCHATAYRTINKYIDKFEVWIGNSNESNFPSKFFKVRGGQ